MGGRLTQDTVWLQLCELGESLPLYDLIVQALNCPAPKWKASLKAATQAEIMAQAAEEDLA